MEQVLRGLGGAERARGAAAAAAAAADTTSTGSGGADVGVRAGVREPLAGVPGAFFVRQFLAADECAALRREVVKVNAE